MPVSSANRVPLLRRCARIGATIAWAALIFAASARPDLRVADDQLLDLVLRKAAHVFVFGVLALLVLHALGGLRPWRGGLAVAAWIVAVLYAASDEWHQTFVEGRVGHASDVAIDASGALVALLLARTWTRRRREAAA